VLLTLLASRGFAACSSSNASTQDAAAPDAADAGADGGDDGGDDATTGQVNDSSGGGPGLDISLQAADGCWMLGASCADPSTCCSGLCADASCSEQPKQQ
jgi:hypothetical protein